MSVRGFWCLEQSILSDESKWVKINAFKNKNEIVVFDVQIYKAEFFTLSLFEICVIIQRTKVFFTTQTYKLNSGNNYN